MKNYCKKVITNHIAHIRMNQTKFKNNAYKKRLEFSRIVGKCLNLPNKLWKFVKNERNQQIFYDFRENGKQFVLN